MHCKCVGQVLVVVLAVPGQLSALTTHVLLLLLLLLLVQATMTPVWVLSLWTGRGESTARLRHPCSHPDILSTCVSVVSNTLPPRDVGLGWYTRTASRAL
jgi:hypothetical protein